MSPGWVLIGLAMVAGGVVGIILTPAVWTMTMALMIFCGSAILLGESRELRDDLAARRRMRR